MLFDHYALNAKSFDEYFSTSGHFRERLQDVLNVIDKFSIRDMHDLDERAKMAFRERGITFRLNEVPSSNDNIFPFDVLPRIITADEWAIIQRGLVQRIKALNAFLCDIYDKQRIITDGIMPEGIIASCSEFSPELRGIRPSGGIYLPISGCDLIRNTDGNFYVLEDNLRVPSGVSYLLENRKMMQELYPEWMKQLPLHEVDNYPDMLRQTLQSLASHQTDRFVVVLTPGPYNSAYYEHDYLAKQMDCPLVENADLFVKNQYVYWRSPAGEQRVDVIYRRTDEQFLDPSFFRPDSLLGIPGLVEAYRLGHVALANALGTGVADDKAIYHFVPAMIRYYLNEEPVLPQINTLMASIPAEQNYILAHLSELVIKVVNQSGGYGMLIGPQASLQEIEDFREKIIKMPRAYIAQPLVQLSTIPTLSGDNIQPLRVDLRVYILHGNNGTWVLPGALTRVALRKGSYVVNSCQGGGSKDTWVMKK